MSDLPSLPPRIPGGPSDDRDQWMAVSMLSDHDIDELIAGRTPEGMQDLAGVALVSRALRERTAFETAPAMGLSLRQALADAPAVTTRSHMGRFRRRLSGMAAAGVGLFAFGAATAANALPTPVQAMVSEAGDLVGVAVPHPADRASDAFDQDDGNDPPSTNLGTGGDPGSGGAQGVSHEGQPEPEDIGTPATTPPGTVPADPGTPGDQEPAAPASPGEDGHGLNPDGSAPGNDQTTGSPGEDPIPVDAGTPNQAANGHTRR